jgi:uncharacterized protein YlxW (UPF0749 family)
MHGNNQLAGDYQALGDIGRHACTILFFVWLDRWTKLLRPHEASLLGYGIFLVTISSLPFDSPTAEAFAFIAAVMNVRLFAISVSDSAKITKDVANIKTKTTKIETDVGTLQQDVRTIQQNVRIIQQDVRTLQQDVGTIQQNVRIIQQDVRTLQQDVGTLQQDVAQIRQNMATKEDIRSMLEEAMRRLPVPQM